jgi:hypothetical protein
MAAPTCRFVASQLGRTVELEAGAGVLMSNAEVGSILLSSLSRFVTFRVPREAMALLVPDLEAAVARRIPPGNSALKLLVDYLQIARDREALTTPDLQRIAVTHVCDLLAVALGATRDATEIAHGRGMRAASPPLGQGAYRAKHRTPRFVTRLGGEANRNYSALSPHVIRDAGVIVHEVCHRESAGALP